MVELAARYLNKVIVIHDENSENLREVYRTKNNLANEEIHVLFSNHNYHFKAYDNNNIMNKELAGKQKEKNQLNTSKKIYQFVSNNSLGKNTNRTGNNPKKRKRNNENLNNIGGPSTRGHIFPEPPIKKSNFVPNPKSPAPSQSQIQNKNPPAQIRKNPQSQIQNKNPPSQIRKNPQSQIQNKNPPSQIRKNPQSQIQNKNPPSQIRKNPQSQFQNQSVPPTMPKQPGKQMQPPFFFAQAPMNSTTTTNTTTQVVTWLPQSQSQFQAPGANFQNYLKQ